MAYLLRRPSFPISMLFAASVLFASTTAYPLAWTMRRSTA